MDRSRFLGPRGTQHQALPTTRAQNISRRPHRQNRARCPRRHPRSNTGSRQSKDQCPKPRRHLRHRIARRSAQCGPSGANQEWTRPTQRGLSASRVRQRAASEWSRPRLRHRPFRRSILKHARLKTVRTRMRSRAGRLPSQCRHVSHEVSSETRVHAIRFEVASTSCLGLNDSTQPMCCARRRHSCDYQQCTSHRRPFVQRGLHRRSSE